jgi:glyoxylase-like metal-dependent hydrolase (beta-lactamase superfamily II)
MTRQILANNPSAMTLDGTRTYIVGARHVAIIDPGPSLRPHRDAIIEAVADPPSGEAILPGHGVAFDSITILLTHSHPDHAAGARALAAELDAEVRGVAHGNLHEGDTIRTDAGALVTLATPGHTPDHASFWLEDAATVFCGDLMMGGLDTALVSPPEGNLREYIESLERIRTLRPERILPAHGPPFDDADAAVSRYIEHRMKRCKQVATALAGGASLTTREVAERVYGGEVPDDLREVAVGAVVAYLEYLEEGGRVVRTGGRWRLTA